MLRKLNTEGSRSATLNKFGLYKATPLLHLKPEPEPTDNGLHGYKGSTGKLGYLQHDDCTILKAPSGSSYCKSEYVRILLE